MYVQKDFQKIHDISRHSKVLQGVISLLDWDHETYMPPAGAGIRAEQIKTLTGLVHREKTGRKFANALQKLIDLPTGNLKVKGLSLIQEAALFEWRKDYIKDTAIPAKFVEEFAQLTSESVLVWRTAKKNNAFLQFAPYLDRIIALNRRKAEYLGYQDHPYDALLDLYEPNVTTKEVATVFSQLRDKITPLLKKIKSAPQIKDDFLFGNWDTSKQIAFGHQLLEAIGYDSTKGRIDFSSHPFSSSCHPTDSRITTRIHATSLMSNIMVILHEGGHSLYEMGLSPDQYGTPIGEARSLGIHESQSRWWETRIGLSKPFWRYFLPKLKETFKGQLDSVSIDEFHRAINKVEPSLIRVEADEVTYPLHVILRFEMEKALIEGSMNTRDIPEAWNAKMKDYLGIEPANNAEGCLQDIHWSMGAFGYFPTYTLGNLYAAHLFEAFAKQNPDWKERVENGELDFVRQWLHEHIYQHGRRYSSQELLFNATGKTFSADAYVHYLTKKYGAIYGV